MLIDRSLLDSENIYNRTVLVVKSSNGGSEVEVRAVGVERVLPVVNTLGVTKIAAMTACLNAEFVDYGSAGIHGVRFSLSYRTDADA